MALTGVKRGRKKRRGTKRCGFRGKVGNDGTHVVLEESVPITTHAGWPRWRVWTEKQATAALRAAAERQDLNPEQYYIQQQGWWESDAIGIYKRDSRGSAEKASQAFWLRILRVRGNNPGKVVIWEGRVNM